MIKEEEDKEEDIESKEVGDGVLMRTRSFVAKIPPPGLSSTQISYHEEMERGMAYVWGAIPVFFFFFSRKEATMTSNEPFHTPKQVGHDKHQHVERLQNVVVPGGTATLALSSNYFAAINENGILYT